MIGTTVLDMGEPTATPLRQLLNVKLHGGLRERVLALYMGERKGWRLTARAITTETGVDVSHEALRDWYGEDPDFQRDATERAS